MGVELGRVGVGVRGGGIVEGNRSTLILISGFPTRNSVESTCGSNESSKLKGSSMFPSPFVDFRLVTGNRVTDHVGKGRTHRR